MVDFTNFSKEYNKRSNSQRTSSKISIKAKYDFVNRIKENVAASNKEVDEKSYELRRSLSTKNFLAFRARINIFEINSFNLELTTTQRDKYEEEDNEAKIISLKDLEDPEVISDYLRNLSKDQALSLDKEIKLYLQSKEGSKFMQGLLGKISKQAVESLYKHVRY